MEPVRARKETGSPVGNGCVGPSPPLLFESALDFFFFFRLEDYGSTNQWRGGLACVLSEEVQKSSYKVLKEHREGSQQVSRASP